MGCFKLPLYFTKDIERLMSKFWWEDTKGKGIHWIRWSEMCKSKTDGGLGFRDLESFNLALLAKQLWRLIEKPNSLLGRIYKARYFPTSGVLGAKLGPNPSFTWRCILSTKNIVEGGLRWRVGNGASIALWTDRWIPRETTFKLITPQGDLPMDMRVKELMVEGANHWNEELVRQLFFEDDSRIILSIPLGQSCNEDKLVWHYERNGRFSVRSAYYLATLFEVDDSRSSTSHSYAGTTNAWKWVWSMDLPNKIKIFVWRACKNLLPTRANLSRRKITAEVNCVRCGGEVEDLRHCLVTCAFARQLWALSNIPWSIHRWNGFELMDWFMHMRKSADRIVLENCVVICWALWYYRNITFFEGDSVEPMDVVSFALNFVNQVRHPFATVLSLRNLSCIEEVKWQPPPMGFIKINFDAAINSNDGKIGLGIIARNHAGVCMGWKSICVRQALDPTSAEAKAAIVAVEFVRDQTWRKIVIEGDSSLVIKAINEVEEDCSAYGTLVADIHVLAAVFGTFSAQHVRRTGNRVAHALAKLSICESYCGDSLPINVQNIVGHELI